jgi:hypothetical protein
LIITYLDALIAAKQRKTDLKEHFEWDRKTTEYFAKVQEASSGSTLNQIKNISENIMLYRFDAILY